jgi:hypothetical protein
METGSLRYDRAYHSELFIQLDQKLMQNQFPIMFGKIYRKVRKNYTMYKKVRSFVRRIFKNIK